MTPTLLSVLLLTILLPPFLPVFVAGSFGMSMSERLKHMGRALIPFVPSNVYLEAYRAILATVHPRLGARELQEMETFEREYDASTKYELVILFTPLLEMGASTIGMAALSLSAFGFFAYKQFIEGVTVAPVAFFVAFWFWWPSVLRTGHLMTMPLRRVFAGTIMRGSFISVVTSRFLLQAIVLLVGLVAGVLMSVFLVPLATLSMAFKSYRRLKTLRDACATFQGT